HKSQGLWRERKIRYAFHLLRYRTTDAFDMSVQTKEQTATVLQDEYKYWAFISYSHQDEAWASWLHKSLETYKVPRKLVGRKLETGVVPRRIFPIFRDREELPGAADLGGKLKNALRSSRYLIIICSPKSAVSQWVNEEIKTYKALGREDRVLCLIVDGEPYASEKPQSGLLECFPEAVRYRVAENGELPQIKQSPLPPMRARVRTVAPMRNSSCSQASSMSVTTN
ncbi:MAG TPA: toll/interleukin-1 receptor domain-containing protein, partial [Pyrinomonadaceae bacterium]